MVQYGINLNPRHPMGQPRNINELIGVRWARIVFKAAAAFQTVDQAFAFYDPLVNQYNQIGMRTIMVLNQETFWGNGPWQNGDWDRYAREFGVVCGNIAARYRGKGVAFQIWNEGDISGMSSVFVPPAEFAKVLDAAARAIKEADPNALVTIGGLASGAAVAVDYVNKIRGALNGRLPVDSLSVHPYGQWPPNFDSAPNWGGWFGRLENHMQTIVNAFPNMPLWITEIGISEEVNFPPEQYPMVVKYMQGIYDLVRTRYANNVAMVVWFAWSDVMRQAGIVDSNGNPKGAVYNKFFEIARATQHNPPPVPLAQMRGVLLRTTDGLSLREGAGTNFTRITVIPRGTEVRALEAPQTVAAKVGVDNQWLNIRTPTGQDGWSAAWFLELSRVVVATTTDLNIRSGPGTQHERITAVQRNTLLTVLDSLQTVIAKIGQEGQWLQVRTPAGQNGWAAAWFVTLGEVAQPPDEEPEPPTRTLVYPTTNLNIRTGPSVNDERIETVLRNTPLLALESQQQVLAKIGKQDQWLNVETREGRTGWAAAWFLSLQPVDAPAVRLTPTTHLNLRAAPNVESDRIIVMPPDMVLTVLEDPQGALDRLGEDGWIKVRTPDNNEGWASARYLRRL